MSAIPAVPTAVEEHSVGWVCPSSLPKRVAKVTCRLGSLQPNQRPSVKVKRFWFYIIVQIM